MIKKYWYLFFLSMLPIVELRGGVPVGVSMGFPFWQVYLVCVLGNLLPVPFLILFAKKIMDFMAAHNIFGGLVQRIIDKAEEKAKTIGKYELVGLWAFVAIPLPGTGAWTGSLVATLLRMRLLPACISIALGVLTSGLIMGVLSYGLLEALGIFL